MFSFGRRRRRRSAEQMSNVTEIGDEQEITIDLSNEITQPTTVLSLLSTESEITTSQRLVNQ